MNTQTVRRLETGFYQIDTDSNLEDGTLKDLGLSLERVVNPWSEGEVDRRVVETWHQLDTQKKDSSRLYPVVEGSFFDPTLMSWNLASFPSIFQLCNYRKQVHPGISIPFGYRGFIGTIFGFHIEDMDLYSVNFIHCSEREGNNV